MKLVFLFTALSVISLTALSQKKIKPSDMEDISHLAIPEYPEKYSAGLVAARVVDGLWFRFYWATEGLRKEDLSYRPGPEVRNTEETVDHILGMTGLLLNATLMKVNEGGRGYSNLSYEEKRQLALDNIEQASKILKQSSAKDIENYKVVFQNQDGTREYPFWNLLNGPIIDCVWHCGQIVSFRRSSGNPFNGKASMFQGRLREG